MSIPQILVDNRNHKIGTFYSEFEASKIVDWNKVKIFLEAIYDYRISIAFKTTIPKPEIEVIIDLIRMPMFRYYWDSDIQFVNFPLQNIDKYLFFEDLVVRIQNSLLLDSPKEFTQKDIDIWFEDIFKCIVKEGQNYHYVYN
jgi:hypothetical protein